MDKRNQGNDSPVPKGSDNSRKLSHQSDLTSDNQCQFDHLGDQKGDELTSAEMHQMLMENLVPGLDHFNIFSFWVLFK
jgi:hypothetical protein